MKTVQAENETLKADLAATLSGMRADIARHREDAARRETRLILAVAVIVGVGLTIFGFLTASPGVWKRVKRLNPSRRGERRCTGTSSTGER